jgi:hypothetical protein
MSELSQTSQNKLCFVIGPIGAANSEERRHADWLLEGIIRPVFKEFFPGFDVKRADEIPGPGNINSQVINRLLDAELVIADMSFHNANAFYELGLRHMAELPTIYVIRNEDKIPFDNAPYRAIVFSLLNHADLETAQEQLKGAVEEVIKPNFQVENPVTNARGFIQLQKHATPEQQLLNDQLQTISARVDRLEKQRMMENNLATLAGSGGLLADAFRIAGKNKTYTLLDVTQLQPGVTKKSE